MLGWSGQTQGDYLQEDPQTAKTSLGFMEENYPVGKPKNLNELLDRVSDMIFTPHFPTIGWYPEGFYLLIWKWDIICW